MADFNPTNERKLLDSEMYSFAWALGSKNDGVASRFMNEVNDNWCSLSESQKAAVGKTDTGSFANDGVEIMNNGKNEVAAIKDKKTGLVVPLHCPEVLQSK